MRLSVLVALFVAMCFASYSTAASPDAIALTKQAQDQTDVRLLRESNDNDEERGLESIKGWVVKLKSVVGFKPASPEKLQEKSKAALEKTLAKYGDELTAKGYSLEKVKDLDPVELSKLLSEAAKGAANKKTFWQKLGSVAKYGGIAVVISIAIYMIMIYHARKPIPSTAKVGTATSGGA